MPILRKIYPTNRKQEAFAILDIGSHKVACLIVTTTDQNDLQIIGIGHNASTGIQRGQIAHLQNASESIGQAIQTAEKMADHTLTNIYCNLGGNVDLSKNIIIETDLPKQIIKQDDLESIAKEIELQIPLESENLVHSHPIHYTLDGHINVADPRGMSGEKLDIEFFTLVTKKTILQNITQTLNQCHIDPAGFIKPSIASGFSCLEEDEMEIGSTLIDFGAETVSIALFYNKKPIYTSTIPLGGQDITNDIARGLNTSLFDAERLKILHGHALGNAQSNEIMEVPTIGDKGKGLSQNLPKIRLDQIISARLEEIFEMIQKNIRSSGFQHLTGERIVLTGGSSQLPGLTEFASQFLRSQARIGYPASIQGLGNYAQNPAFSCATGMLLYLHNNIEDYALPLFNQKFSPGILKKVSRWVKTNF